MGIDIWRKREEQLLSCWNKKRERAGKKEKIGKAIESAKRLCVIFKHMGPTYNSSHVAYIWFKQIKYLRCFLLLGSSSTHVELIFFQVSFLQRPAWESCISFISSSFLKNSNLLPIERIDGYHRFTVIAWLRHEVGLL